MLTLTMSARAITARTRSSQTERSCMTRGREFGSSMTRVRPVDARSRPPAPTPSDRGRGRACRDGTPPGASPSAATTASSVSSGAEVSAVWNRYVARPYSSSSAIASVVGASVVVVSERSTPSSASVSWSHRPNRSDERTPRNATSPPSRPIVRAVLYGPPPRTAASRPSGRTRMSMRASPATTIMGVMVRARRTLHAHGPPHRRRRAARRSPRRPGRADRPTCATCAGSTAGWAASA